MQALPGVSRRFGCKPGVSRRFGCKPVVDSACESGFFFHRASLAAAVRKFFGLGPLFMSIAIRHGRLRSMKDTELELSKRADKRWGAPISGLREGRRYIVRASWRVGDRTVVACGGGACALEAGRRRTGLEAKGRPV